MKYVKGVGKKMTRNGRKMIYSYYSFRWISLYWISVTKLLKKYSIVRHFFFKLRQVFLGSSLDFFHFLIHLSTPSLDRLRSFLVFMLIRSTFSFAYLTKQNNKGPLDRTTWRPKYIKWSKLKNLELYKWIDINKDNSWWCQVSMQG